MNDAECAKVICGVKVTGGQGHSACEKWLERVDLCHDIWLQTLQLNHLSSTHSHSDIGRKTDEKHDGFSRLLSHALTAITNCTHTTAADVRVCWVGNDRERVKTTEPIKMSFGMNTGVGPTNHALKPGQCESMMKNWWKLLPFTFHLFFGADFFLSSAEAPVGPSAHLQSTLRCGKPPWGVCESY